MLASAAFSAVRLGRGRGGQQLYTLRCIFMARVTSSLRDNLNVSYHDRMDCNVSCHDRMDAAIAPDGRRSHCCSGTPARGFVICFGPSGPGRARSRCGVTGTPAMTGARGQRRSCLTATVSKAQPASEPGHPGRRLAPAGRRPADGVPTQPARCSGADQPGHCQTGPTPTRRAAAAIIRVMIIIRDDANGPDNYPSHGRAEVGSCRVLTQMRNQ